MKAKDAATDLTQDRLKSLLSYDEETGVFRWNEPTSTKMRRGDIAGSPHKGGYWTIMIDRRRFFAHRLAWFYVYGVWPKYLLDHRDTNKMNNAIANLRSATMSQNKANGTYANSPKGLKGITRKGSKWGAQIVKDQQHIWLGTFETPEQAAAAYAKAAETLHGEFARTGAHQ